MTTTMIQLTDSGL